MKTIRRIYFYLVTAISIELLAWGVINLLRSIFRAGLPGVQSQSLSIGLAQILVSIPIFIVHWMVVQKDSAKSDEEQTSLVRAMFLYGILLGTLIPVVQNILAFVNRLLLDTGGGERVTALVGSSQSATDNLIAVAINLLLAAYFYSTLQKDWKFNPNPANLIDLRRVYTYIWVLYGLGMTILGVQQLIHFMLRKSVLFGANPLTGLVNPATLLVLGVPIWVYTWTHIQKSISGLEERHSTWRVVVLYFLVLTGAISTAVAAITALGWILRASLGDSTAVQNLLWKLSPSLSSLIPFSVLWAYYSRHLRWDIASRPDTFSRDAMTRLYRYILAFLGLAGTVTGLIGLLRYIVDYLTGVSIIVLQSYAIQIAQNLALLLVSIVYWLIFFLPENRMAQNVDESAEHSRRSLTRKVYLYVIVFAGVVGVMVTGGTTIYVLLESLFNGTTNSRLQDILRGFSQVVVFGVFLGYHLASLRRDARAVTRTLAEKHAEFPVAIAADMDSFIGNELAQAFIRLTPAIPVHFVGENAALEDLSFTPKAVVLPSSIITRPDQKWVKMLAGFTGAVLTVPESTDRWVWIHQPGKMEDMARSAAISVRNLAEGRPLVQQKTNSLWAILGYVLAGLLVVMVLMIVLGTVFGG